MNESTRPAGDKIPRGIRPQALEPPLRLVGPDPNTLRCRAIKRVDPVSPEARIEAHCYGFAVIALYYPSVLPLPFWWQLVKAWPPRSGPPPNLFGNAYAAQAVRLGATEQAVAAAWGDRKPGSARRRKNRGMSMSLVASGTADRWAVTIVKGDEAGHILGVAPERIAERPLDPGSDEAQIAALVPDWDWVEQDNDALGRAMDALSPTHELPSGDEGWCDDFDEADPSH